VTATKKEFNPPRSGGKIGTISRSRLPKKEQSIRQQETDLTGERGRGRGKESIGPWMVGVGKKMSLHSIRRKNCASSKNM